MQTRASTVVLRQCIVDATWTKHYLFCGAVHASFGAVLEANMIKPMLLKLHRWTSLAFAAPLLAILVSGFGSVV
ncbi:hypothetical protein [Bradyrhizobium sp.]|uniref:hypothetical protein n=1 Tax=Bradyrhizobium sp. TaxID=376 RepID=UPI003C42F3E8